MSDPVLIGRSLTPGGFRLRVAGVLALLAFAAAAGDELQWQGEDFDPDFLTAQPASAGQLPDVVPVLIRQLGDESFEKRQEASRALAALGRAARAPLEAAARSPDPEVAERAGKLVAELTRRKQERLSKATPLLRLQVPVYPSDASKYLACIGTNPVPLNEVRRAIDIAMPPAADAAGARSFPFFLVLGGTSWQPVPVWIGPRRVPLPEDDTQLPWQPALTLVEYDLLAELDENWQPTTPRAKARVQAVASFLAAGGSLNSKWQSAGRVAGWIAAYDQLLPAAPVREWVATLRQRLAQGDLSALAGLLSLRASLSVDELRQLLKTMPGPGRGLIANVICSLDPGMAAGQAQELLSGQYANDVPLLELLGQAGVLLDPSKLNYPAGAFGSGRMMDDHAVLRYCRRMGLKVPDGLVEAWVESSDLSVNCAGLLSASQVGALKKMLQEQKKSERALFHARYLLFQSGDQSQEAEFLKLFPPGTPYQKSYSSHEVRDYRLFALSHLAAEGGFPALARQFTRQDLFDRDKVSPELFWILRTHIRPELIAEVGRKLDDEAVRGLSWHLGYWRCRAAVPAMIRMLDAGDIAGMVPPLCQIADPAAGPSLVRTIEHLEKSDLHGGLRLRAMEGVLRMGADFPEGKQTLLRVSAREKRFSAFRMVALAGLARQAPAEHLPPLLREIEAAPPAGLPLFLKWLGATRLPEVVPVLKQYVKHRYAPAAEAAALALLELGDSSSLPYFYEHRYWWRQNWDLARDLLACWREDTPAAEVKMIRQTLDAIAYPARCASRAEWVEELGRQSANY